MTDLSEPQMGELIFRKKYRCPVCDFEQGPREGILINTKKISGIYCMECYAAWIDKNIPKMEKINDD